MPTSLSNGKIAYATRWKNPLGVGFWKGETETDKGEIVVFGSTDDTELSNDIINFAFTNGNLPASTNWRAGAYSPELDIMIVCGGQSGNFYVAYSSDRGLTWNTGLSTATVINWCTYSPALQLFVVSANNQIFYSNDGINYTQASTTGTVPAGNWYRVQWLPSNSKFIANVSSAQGANSVIYSNDGINWTYGSLNSGTFTDQFIEVANGRIISIGDSSSIAKSVYSDDGGTSWTIANIGVTISTRQYPIAYNEFEGIIYAAINGNNKNIYKSADNGVTWSIAHTVNQGYVQAGMVYYPRYKKCILISRVISAEQCMVFDEGTIDLISLQSGINWFNSV